MNVFETSAPEAASLDSPDRAAQEAQAQAKCRDAISFEALELALRIRPARREWRELEALIQQIRADAKHPPTGVA